MIRKSVKRFSEKIMLNRQPRLARKPKSSAPSHRRGDMLQNGLDHMRVVVNAQLVGDGEKQRIGLGDRFIRLELLDQHIRLGRIASAEDRPRSLVDESGLILTLALMSEIGAIAIVDQREDAAADRDARLARMA